MALATRTVVTRPARPLLEVCVIDLKDLEHSEDEPIFDVEFTPRHWEFGFGVYAGNKFVNAFTGTLTHLPPSLFLMVGPWTLTINFGRNKLERP